MKTAQQWLEEMKAHPCVTENDLLVIIERIQEDAAADAAGLPDSILEAFNRGDGVYRP